ncbi:hypothetical protein B5F13_00690 [Drancourtella sp. An177]|nr:hypothetical protein B5F13_00690 [Drancourtella sp. An177]
MLTLKELRGMVTVTESEDRVPTAKQLLESGAEVIVKEALTRDTTISVFANGFVLYRAGKHYTVFSIEDCGTYGYESVKDAFQVYEASFFDNENWYVRLIMEAEDRLERNQDRIKSNHKVCSYDRMVEEGSEIESDEEGILESLVKDDLIKRMLEKLNERQREIIYLFYFEQWRQQDIAEYFGVSQQNVSDMIRRVLKILSTYAMQEKNN